MNSFPKKILLTVLLLFLFFIISFFIYAVWERNRDPLSAIDQVSSNLIKLNETSFFDSTDSRVYKEIDLLSESTDTVKAIISFPENYQNKKYPLIVILGGLHIGRKNFELIPDPGENILAIYLYPYSPDYWYEGNALYEMIRIRESILKVPAQVVEFMKWSRRQQWTDKNKISLLGYSFGALFLPATNRLSEKYDVKPDGSVLAYGGVDLEMLLKTNFKFKPKFIRGPLALFASTLIYPVEPALHVPFLKGDLFVINGRLDKQIPNKSWRKLHSLMPDPDSILILDEGHMHPRKPELTLKLVKLSRKWLENKVLINP